MTGPSLLCCLFLLLGGVFGDTDEVTVSVMEGESVTLHIKPEETQRTDRLWWRFNSEETAIVTLDKETNEIINDDKRFRDRLKLDVVSGSLTITNSRTTDSGDYTLEISRKSGGSIYKRFRVTVSDVVITVMEGESVTLPTDVNLQTDAVIQWKFKGNIIADLTGPVHDGFRNSEVNEQTGDLIITNIRRDQSGDYKVEINSRSLILHRTFRVNVREVKTVSVGDSVTLQTDVKIQRDDVIQWKFNDTIIADLTGRVHDERFRNSEVNEQTGDLIITNIRRDQSGDYEMKINGTRLILHRTFRVNVMEVKTVSVGDSVTLQTDVKIQTHDMIQWKFKGDIIADLKGHVHERFTNSEVNKQTGDLIITNIRGDQSGDYEMKINGKRLQKIFRVNVGQEKSSGLSAGAVAGILVAVVVVVVVVVGVVGVGVGYLYRRRKLWVNMKTVTVMERDPLTLPTGVTVIQSDDEIQWRFRETLIAEIKRKKMKIFTDDDDVQRFRDRLKLNEQTGGLTISDIRPEDTGCYKLKFSTSRGTSESLFIVVVTAGIRGNEPAPVNHHLLNEAEDPV